MGQGYVCLNPGDSVGTVAIMVSLNIKEIIKQCQGQADNIPEAEYGPG
jgi:hypothetical protein